MIYGISYNTHTKTTSDPKISPDYKVKVLIKTQVEF